MRLALIFLILNCLPTFAQVIEPPDVEFPEVEKPKATEYVIFGGDCDATFPGGVKSLKRHFEKYQHDCWEDSIPSKTGYVWFTVEADGSLTGIQVRRGISLELNDLMLRIIEEMPRWTPACDLDGPVRSRVQLPITFTCTEE